MESKLSDKIVKGLIDASPLLLLLSFFTCLIYVGVMQKEYYEAVFQGSMPGKNLFIGIFVSIGIGLCRLASMFSSVSLYRADRLGPALLMLGISVAIAYFEHHEAGPMAEYFANNGQGTKEAFELLYQASVWFTLPLELGIAFIFSETKEEIQPDKAIPIPSTTPHHTETTNPLEGARPILNGVHGGDLANTANVGN